MTDSRESFGAAIDEATMKRMEQAAQGAGVNRRLVLLALARDSETLARARVEAHEAFADMLESVEAFAEHASAMHEAALAAANRLRLADCRGVH